MKLIELRDFTISDFIAMNPSHKTTNDKQIAKIMQSVLSKGWDTDAGPIVVLEKNDGSITTFTAHHRQEAVKRLVKERVDLLGSRVIAAVINHEAFIREIKAAENPNAIILQVQEFLESAKIPHERIYLKMRLRTLAGLSTMPRTNHYNILEVTTAYPQIAIMGKEYGHFYEKHMGKKCGRALEVAMAIYFGEPRGKQVIELGGRNSFLSPYISNIVKSITVVDNFLGWKEFGGEEIWFDKWVEAAEDKSRLSCEKQEITHLSCNDNSFDLAIALSVIEHSFVSPDSDIECMKEIARVLKPGGMLVMSTDFKEEFDSNPHFRHYTEEVFLERLVKPSGLIIDADRDLKPKSFDPRWGAAMVFLTKPGEKK